MRLDRARVCARVSRLARARARAFAPELVDVEARRVEAARLELALEPADGLAVESEVAGVVVVLHDLARVPQLEVELPAQHERGRRRAVDLGLLEQVREALERHLARVVRLGELFPQVVPLHLVHVGLARGRRGLRFGLLLRIRVRSRLLGALRLGSRLLRLPRAHGGTHYLKFRAREARV